MEMKRTKGFSLIELLVVIAVILLIAAIAVPNLLRSRMAANEASAAASVRAIHTGETSYAMSYPQSGFTLNLTNLGPGAGNTTCPPSGPTETGACLIDSLLAAALRGNQPKSGYYFALGPGESGNLKSPVGDYVVAAGPAAYNNSGVKTYCATSDGIVRATVAGSADMNEASAVNYDTCVGGGFSATATDGGAAKGSQLGNSGSN
jgi:prepilin-type N-terminal cleavage/methylation domain-containing protein